MDLNVVLNCHYIGIKKCCGSCMHKRVTDEGLRLCRHHRKYVYKTNCCEYWSMDRRLDRPGAKWGQQKSHDYIQFVARIRALESQRIEEAEAKGVTLAMLKIETIQKRYKKLYGDIFMDF